MENILFAFIGNYLPLSEAEKQVIRDLALFRAYPKGAVILQEGHRSTDSYFVLKGCLRCFYVIDGEEKTTAFFTESEGLTPPHSVTNTPSDLYLACVEDSLIAVSNPVLEGAVFEKFPRFETLCRLVSEAQLAKSQISFDAFKYSSPQQRYEQLLETRPDLLQRVPLHQLASFLGITPESLSRIRKRLLTRAASALRCIP